MEISSYLKYLYQFRAIIIIKLFMDKHYNKINYLDFCILHFNFIIFSLNFHHFWLLMIINIFNLFSLNLINHYHQKINLDSSKSFVI